MLTENESPHAVSTISLDNILPPNQNDVSISKAEPNLLSRIGTAIVERYDSKVCHALGVLSIRERAMLEVAESHRKDYHPYPDYEQSNGSEHYFVERIYGSNSLAMWYLLTSGILQKSVTALTAKANGVIDEEEVVSRVYKGFLNKLQEKNTERFYYKNPNLLTVGLEIEYLLSKLPPVEMETLRGILIRQQPHYPSYGWSMMDDRAKKLANTNNLPYDYKREAVIADDRIVGEVALDPSASPTTQLRDVLHLLKSGIISLESNSLHVNIAGLKLDTDNIEPMIITSIISGLGYNSSMFAKDQLPASVQESFKKRSDDWLFYPHHKSRKPTSSYKKERTDEVSTEFRGNCHYDNFTNIVKGVENTYWLSVSAAAYQKIRINHSGSTEETLRLAEIWRNLEIDWLNLLKSRNIYLNAKESIIVGTKKIEDIGRRENTVLLCTQEEVDTPYNRALGKIIFETERDLEFQRLARELVIKTRKEIRGVFKS